MSTLSLKYTATYDRPNSDTERTTSTSARPAIAASMGTVSSRSMSSAATPGDSV